MLINIYQHDSVQLLINKMTTTNELHHPVGLEAVILPDGEIIVIFSILLLLLLYFVTHENGCFLYVKVLKKLQDVHL